MSASAAPACPRFMASKTTRKTAPWPLILWSKGPEIATSQILSIFPASQSLPTYSKSLQSGTNCVVHIIAGLCVSSGKGLGISSKDLVDDQFQRTHTIEWQGIPDFVAGLLQSTGVFRSSESSVGSHLWRSWIFMVLGDLRHTVVMFLSRC